MTRTIQLLLAFTSIIHTVSAASSFDWDIQPQGLLSSIKVCHVSVKDERKLAELAARLDVATSRADRAAITRLTAERDELVAGMELLRNTIANSKR